MLMYPVLGSHRSWAGGFRTLARDRRTLGGVRAVEFLRMSALVFARTSAGFCKTLPEFVDGTGSKSSVGGTKIEPRRAKLRPRAPKLSPRRIQRRFFCEFSAILEGFAIFAASLEGQNSQRTAQERPKRPRRSPRKASERPQELSQGTPWKQNVVQERCCKHFFAKYQNLEI